MPSNAPLSDQPVSAPAPAPAEPSTLPRDAATHTATYEQLEALGASGALQITSQAMLDRIVFHFGRDEGAVNDKESLRKLKAYLTGFTQVGTSSRGLLLPALCLLAPPSSN